MYSLYYGEIAALMAARLFQNPDHAKHIEHSMNELEKDGDTIWSMIATAARVFDTIEDLSGELFVDWHKALQHYSDAMLDHLLNGQKPGTIDMVAMASRSIADAT